MARMLACRTESATLLGPGRDESGVVLGIDPGLIRTGFAFLRRASDAFHVVDAGVIRLRPRQSIESRLVELEQCLDALIATHRPFLLACEELYAHYRHPRTAILMGHARGVILSLAGRRGVTVLPVSATHVKKTLTGNGHAGKAQIQRAIAAILRLARMPGPADVADALAIAMCGMHSVAASRRNAEVDR
jgi:crossover junction endodeoxyribonuclease RuvC